MTEQTAINYNITNMTTDGLLALRNTIDAEIRQRLNERRQKYIDNVCNAINELVNNFPDVELEVTANCEDCGYSVYIDVLDYFKAGDCDRGCFYAPNP